MSKEELLRNLKGRGFTDDIVKAFESVDREKFVLEETKNHAYEDTALPIGFGQTISQPYTIAFMLSELKLDKKQKILEIGSGSGYVLALMNEVTEDSEFYGVERIEDLAERSKEILKNKKNIQIIHRDGSKGLPEEAPFDRILVSAAFQEMPNHLVRQLKLGGILIAPVRNSIIQIQRFTNDNKIQEFEGFAFVPVVED